MAETHKPVEETSVLMRAPAVMSSHLVGQGTEGYFHGSS